MTVSTRWLAIGAGLVSTPGSPRLDLHVLDPLDVFVGKLFSARRKGLSDLRALAQSIDKGKAADRLRSSATALLHEPDLAQNATRNWYILFGEALRS